MNKKMDVVKEMAAKLHVDFKSLLMGCLPHILVHILPLSAAAAADEQAKLAAVGFECYNMLIAELGKQVLTIKQTVHVVDKFCQPFCRYITCTSWTNSSVDVNIKIKH